MPAGVRAGFDGHDGNAAAGFNRRGHQGILFRHTGASRIAHGQVRPLRLLPLDVSELPAPRPGNGLSSRAHLPDAGRSARPHYDERFGRKPFRHVSWLHGVRNCLPFRRAVCAIDRRDARRDRASLHAAVRRSIVSPAAVPAAALSSATAFIRPAARARGSPPSLAAPAGEAAASVAEPDRPGARPGVRGRARRHSGEGL